MQTVAIIFALSSASLAEKLPVPSDVDLKASLALIKDVYGQEHTDAKTNEQLQALARKMLSHASETDKPTERYALLRVARDIAAQGCDGELAFQIIGELDEGFRVDAVKMKAGVLNSLTKKARVSTERKSIAEHALDLVHQAVAKDDFETAGKLVQMALSEARKARDNDLLKKVTTKSREVTQLSKVFANVKAAADRLQVDPTDVEANLVVGRYHCLAKGNWEKGLPMLALGSDAALKDLALRELGDVAEPDVQAKLGDSWWELAEGEKSTEQRQLRRRAVHWYRRAVDGLTGLRKSIAASRIKTADAAAEVPEAPTLRREISVDIGDGVTMEFVLIPAGQYTMGSSVREQQLALQIARARKDKETIVRVPAEGPQHRVKISKPFYLGRYEVTQTQWTTVMGDNPSRFRGSLNPVERVSWDDAQSFMAKLNAAHLGNEMRFRLPTEAEWEVACRAGTATAFCFGENATLLSQHGWFKDNSGGKTHMVGQRKPNAWGLHGMHGNVWEWCWDWYRADSYGRVPRVDPTGPVAGTHRVVRGGGWRSDAGRCRSSYRHSYPTAHREHTIGFRVAF
jgi:formylglycine-generating enzyme required for sulfatase activity